MHAAQGFGYPFPDLTGPLIVTKLVLEDSGQSGEGREAGDRGGRIVMAVLLRLTAEAYLLHDPDAGTPRERWQRFLALHEAARADAAARGLDDAQAFIPPRVARAFGRRLKKLGWLREPWPSFCRRVR